MKNFLKRLFVHLPLYIIWLGSTSTIVMPIIWWLVSGELDGWLEIPEQISCL